MTNKGKFIVFEGIDGCGKGTQLKLIHSYLWGLSKEIDVYTTREPTRDYKEIRKEMAKGTDVKKDAEWYAQMFVQDRWDHVRNYIKPALERGIIVLCDRYKLSTLAYQHTQGMALDDLLKMHKELLVPDLTMIFDCPAETAFERRKKEGSIDVFDKDLEFQKKLRQNYLKLKDILFDENMVIINGSKSVDDVFVEVQGHLGKLF